MPLLTAEHSVRCSASFPRANFLSWFIKLIFLKPCEVATKLCILQEFWHCLQICCKGYFCFPGLVVRRPYLWVTAVFDSVYYAVGSKSEINLKMDILWFVSVKQNASYIVFMERCHGLKVNIPLLSLRWFGRNPEGNVVYKTGWSWIAASYKSFQKRIWDL